MKPSFLFLTEVQPLGFLTALSVKTIEELSVAF